MSLIFSQKDFNFINKQIKNWIKKITTNLKIRMKNYIYYLQMKNVIKIQKKDFLLILTSILILIKKIAKMIQKI